MLLAFEIFGRHVPNFGIFLPLILLVVMYLVFNRNGGLEPGVAGGADAHTGRGPMVTCSRCGRKFQPEQVTLLAGGATETTHDDRCPACGWNAEWGNAENHRPGGASGGWG